MEVIYVNYYYPVPIYLPIMAVAPNNQDLNEVIDDGEEDFSLESIGLTEEEISLIPMVTDIPAGESCTVCLTSFEENPSLVCRLPCNHLFHEECLLPWLQMNVTCPLCRHRLTDRQQLAAFETEDIEDSWSDEDPEDSWSADDHVELWRAVYEGTWSADENFGYDRNEFGVFGSTGHDVSDQRIEWYSGSEDTLPMNLSSDELQSEELNEDEPSCDDELDISMLVNSSVIVLPPGMK